MRNISLSNFESYTLDGVDNCEVYCTCEDHVLLYSKGRVLKFEEKNGKISTTVISNLTDRLYPVNDDQDNSVPKALDISYSFEKNSIFLFLQNGDIVTIEIGDNHTCSSDIVGTVIGGLKACKWSPENEVVALVTGLDSVSLMTIDFDPVSEVELHGGGFGEKQFTTVGWGKKETQFRGSEGKYKAQNNPEEGTKSDIVSDESVRISWRGDAEYFAVSSINPETRERYLRIFSKEGVLQYTSEIIPGLESSLDWRPSGNMIASTQRLPNKHNVCFFEKNGLKHGEFTLPFKQNEVLVKELMWNQDSKLLAVLTERLLDETNFTPGIDNNGRVITNVAGEKLILIYCVNNYHWYCKYSIPFAGQKEIMMKWDHRNSNSLHVFINEDKQVTYNKYSWLWSVNKSRGRTEIDRAFVAVIDGSKLLLTVFKNGILPPPMCTYSLEMPSQINQVGFASGDESDMLSNNLFVHLSNGCVCLYKFVCNGEKLDQISHELIGILESKNEFIYNINWISFKSLAFCERSYKSPKYFLNIIDIQTFESCIRHEENKYPVKSSIALLRFSKSNIVLHDNGGHTYVFERQTGTFSEIHTNQKRSLIELEVIHKDESLVVFGLDKSNKFFINDNMIANNITSFHIHQDFLLLTNLKHRLLCVPIDVDPDKIMGAELNEVSTRRIERGSRLITSVLKDTKVILQMPRGNLECIQPRALSFSVIGKFLDALQYFSAFNIMRQQRINLNLLHDYNPELFRENIEVFIEQIKDPNWISLFLSELVDEDVTKTMYHVIYKKRESLNDGFEKFKISVVCELLERELGKEKYADKYVLPILTTYIKRRETQYIECALKILKKLKEIENSGAKLTVSFDEAFRYMLYLIDVEEMYKVALGMYDFDLVLLVATKSQKDPKEYLPFLNELKKLEVNYQKFMIDKYLKRYEKALKHLLQCGGDDFFTECLTFIKAHKLYKTALKLVPHTTDRYKQICANYAEELLKLHLYEEAGIMFSNSGSYLNAIAAFSKSGNWQEVISCSTKLELTNQEKYDLFKNLAGELEEHKRFKEASIVYMDYLKNVEMAVTALINGKLFAEAFRIAELTGRDDLIQSLIKRGIITSYQNTEMMLKTYGELFTAQKSRLRIVREKKLQHSKESGEGYDTVSDQDAYSESSTVVTQSYAGSRTTNRTFRSAKNKRKQERKLLSLKEGSPFEDLALIASLHNLVTNCLELRTEVRELNKCLVKINELPSAEELQKSLERLLKDIEESKSEIWTADLLYGRQAYGPETTSNSIAASFMKSENSGPSNLINPRLLIPPEVQSNIGWQLEILNV